MAEARATIRGSGVDLDAGVAAAIAVALAMAQGEPRTTLQTGSAIAGGISSWLLEGRRRLMDARQPGRR
ncbi:MAG: hypothetical protein HY682_11270 [Chloroflexi bacterium]|nr:hypothetical protein [Chloroflexota bacterium]